MEKISLEDRGIYDVSSARGSQIYLIVGSEKTAVVDTGMAYSAEGTVENIRKIRDTFHIAIMLIEHDMSLVMRVCERIQVINFGQTIAAGLPEEIASNQEVIEAYLGEEEADDDAED